MDENKDIEMETIQNSDVDIVSEVLGKAETETSIFNILISLISDYKHLTLKTEIHNPKAITFIEMFGKSFTARGYEKTGKYYKDFINTYKANMVSYKRKSRDEIIKAISSWIENRQNKESNTLLFNPTR